MSHTRINPALDFDSQNDTPSPLAQTPVSQTPASESTPSAAPPPAPAGQDDYPPQLHAGKVGYGPSYGRGVGMGEKIAGVKEEVVGKVLRKPETVEHGHLRRTGELKRQEQDAKDRAAFGDPQEQEQEQQAASTAQVGEGPHTGDQERARENVRVV